MESDSSQEQSMKPKVDELRRRVAAGSLRSSIAKVSGSSRGIPNGKDFHFYNSFDEYKLPVKEIEKKSSSMLETIGKSSCLLGKEVPFPSGDLDDAYDWLVNVNDEVLERFDVSVDEFRSLRKKEEDTGLRLIGPAGLIDGFQMVYGKKSKKVLDKREAKCDEPNFMSGVKVGSRAGTSKPKVPFHIPTIPRPQDVYKIVVNNSNQPFTHVWLANSEDDLRFIHPLEKLSFLDFVDKKILDGEPDKPPPIESTPFKLVEEVKDLKVLAAKLQSVDEFAVDLEHNQYRSFQGMTCLMQISTRTEDYVVDALKLRVHIGPYLREVFKDPSKRKVMHGADRDILWLQRDFGIYVCNLFDTGQASRVLKMERNSLEYLLSHFCGVAANKEYQNADWRLRPLPCEMIKYAREDTHYLLYIYDVMRHRLLLSSYDTDDSDNLTEGIDLNTHQLAVVSGLCEWRDAVARAEDESTGYILPNKTLIEIAKQMPLTANKLRRLVKSKHSYVERNLSSVVSIIRHSVQNSSLFEATVQQLKERRTETACEENNFVAGGSIASPSPASMESRLEETIDGSDLNTNSLSGQAPASVPFAETDVGESQVVGCSEHPKKNGNVKTEASGHVSLFPIVGNASGQISDTDCRASIVSVQVSKKPSGAFGALLGASSKRKHPDKKEKEDSKLQQIKSSVNLPFHSFLGREQQFPVAEREPAQPLEISFNEKEPVAIQAAVSCLDVILLDSDSDADESAVDTQPAAEADCTRRDGDLKVENENILSDLSSSFQKCFQPLNQAQPAKPPEKTQECDGLRQFKPFDYEAARKMVKFGDSTMVAGDDSDSQTSKSGGLLGDKKKSSDKAGVSQKDDGATTLPARRRQAFPASGNRSATFR